MPVSADEGPGTSPGLKMWVENRAAVVPLPHPSPVENLVLTLGKECTGTHPSVRKDPKMSRSRESGGL